ncbi:MAG: hypothetical protein JW828_15170 [Sedimentisphaerales bacterium]|nr:hypothetical protein [Sedimentisphaerales bacterium]
MTCNVRIVSTYPPRRCGIGTFSRDLANALENFTGEVGHIRVAAIDNHHGPYHIPVDLVVRQYEPASWQYAIRDILARAREGTHPTVVLLQHEYGLDPDEDGQDCRGHNFVRMAQAFQDKGITTLVYLHTVLEQPDPHQRQTIIDLARYSDGLIVTTECAIDILESDLYGIEHGKLKHIDHGIRMSQPSQYDRLAIKTELGLKDTFLTTTLGLLSPGKGVPYGIRGYGKFIHESLTEQQRRQCLYLIAGQCHPEFVRADGGQPYRRFMAEMETALEQADVRWRRVTDLVNADIDENDIVFLDTFLDEASLLKLYSATNVMVLPYLNMQQMSSGILADTVGCGRAAIATKFRYACELIHSNKSCPPGLVIGRFARGILVDPGEPSVEQIAQALDYLAFNNFKRLTMEKQAHQRGHQMRWDNSAWALIQHVQFIMDEKEIVTGRGIEFQREKESRFERKSKRTII